MFEIPGGSRKFWISQPVTGGEVSLASSPSILGESVIKYSSGVTRYKQRTLQPVARKFNKNKKYFKRFFSTKNVGINFFEIRQLRQSRKKRVESIEIARYSITKRIDKED